MYKKIILLVAVVAMFACSSNNNSSCSSCSEHKQKSKSTAVKTDAKTIDQLFGNAEAVLGKKVTVSGMVSHVCKHSGKKCFLENAKGDLSFRVEAGKVKGFNRELSGTDITVTGIVKGQKISKDQILAYEKKIEAQEKAEAEGGEHCSTENNAITKMKKWMKENKKDYYLNLFMVAESYTMN
jgi:hypothetical protein